MTCSSQSFIDKQLQNEEHMCYMGTLIDCLKVSCWMYNLYSWLQYDIVRTPCTMYLLCLY